MIPVKDVIPTRTRPVVTTSLVVVNALVFGLQAMLPPEQARHLVFGLGLVPAEFSLVDVATSMFLHGGLAALAGNLLYLWIFGDNVEDRLGHGRFLAFYLSGGMAAALSQTFMDPTSASPVLGASGAVAAVLGGYFALFPNSRVLTLFPIPVTLFEVPAVFFLALWFTVQFLSGLASPGAGPGGPPGGVAFWAQATGFVAGVVLVWLLQRPERARVEWWSP